jgi:hypothetical protein
VHAVAIQQCIPDKHVCINCIILLLSLAICCHADVPGSRSLRHQFTNIFGVTKQMSCNLLVATYIKLCHPIQRGLLAVGLVRPAETSQSSETMYKRKKYVVDIAIQTAVYYGRIL